jgi:anti-sigma factor RsiW
MTCALDRERLSLYVSDDLPDGERMAVEAHLRSCASCAAVRDQYLAGAKALTGTYAAVQPPALRRSRRPIWLGVVAAAAVVAITLGAVPSVRAEVTARVAELFGWHSIRVKTEEETHAVLVEDRDGKLWLATDAASARYDRTSAAVVGEEIVKAVSTVAEARAFLGHGVALPAALEGQELYLVKTVTADGHTAKASLAAPGSGSIGFWARYRADGSREQVKTTYGSAFTVKVEERTIGGRPARIITATQASGKSSVELWLEDGNWVYEMHGYGQDRPRLLEMAGSLQP